MASIPQLLTHAILKCMQNSAQSSRQNITPFGEKIRRFARHPTSIIRARLRAIYRPPILKLRTLPSVVALKNRSSRAWYTQHRKPISPLQQRIVQELRHSGIARATLEELSGGLFSLAHMRAFTDRLASTAETARKKQFLKFLWGESVEPLAWDNPFNRLAVSPDVLGIVNEYFGLAAHFYFSSCNIAIPVGETTNAAGSQRWHRDPGAGDDRTLKLFLYINHVDEDTGPFEYVRGSQPTGPLGDIFPARQPNGVYPPEGAVNDHASLRDKIITNTGPAGTVIFCDTLGLHRGGYAKKKERIMATAAYTSPGSIQGFRFTSREKFVSHSPSLSSISSYALGVSS